MDPYLLKLLILAIAAFALFAIARMASASAEQAGALSPLPPEEPEPAPAPPNRPATIGSEIPFPFDVRELEAEYGPDYYRPIIRNYYFRSTDLATGPADPANFHDEFCLELEDSDTGAQWTDSFPVATPAGLDSALQSDKADKVWVGRMLIIRRYDLALILRSALERYAEQRARRDDMDAEAELKSDGG